MTSDNVYAARPSTDRGMNVLALISLIAGILGFNIIAVVLGIVALNMIKKSGESGRGMAIAGIILGCLWIIVIVVIIVVSLVVYSAASVYGS